MERLGYTTSRYIGGCKAEEQEHKGLQCVPKLEDTEDHDYKLLQTPTN